MATVHHSAKQKIKLFHFQVTHFSLILSINGQMYITGTQNGISGTSEEIISNVPSKLLLTIT